MPVYQPHIEPALHVHQREIRMATHLDSALIHQPETPRPIARRKFRNALQA